jgi:uncharacterized RmlC-like cupin family protein
MADIRPSIVRAEERRVAPATAGMQREEAYADDERWLGFVRTDPDIEGGWHHHGERDSYIYVLRGSISIDFGPRGRDRITAHPGDFIFNPARMVHREITGHEPGELIVMRLGPGPQVVNLEGPDPG